MTTTTKIKQKIQLRLSKNLQNSRGYILPAVIALGLGIGTVSVLAIQTVGQNSTTLSNQSYKILAQEAAQAGIAAVKACVLSQPSDWVNTTGNAFSTTNPLTPNEECDGANDTSGSRAAYVTQDTANRVESTYGVTKVTKYPGATTTLLITSVGKVIIKGPNGAVVDTFTKTVRAIVSSVTPMADPVSKPIDQISTGHATACVITDPPESWVYCWGSNTYGQLGNGRYLAGDRSVTPLAVASNTSPQAAIPGTCTSWLIWCLAYDPPDTPTQPASAMAGKKVTKISVGQTHTCAVAKDANDTNPNEPTRRAYCWGNNTYGQLGDRSNVSSLTPVKVADETGWTVPGYCAASLPFVGCVNYVDPVVNPTSALFNKTVVDITAGNGFTCAQTINGSGFKDVVCWGLNDNGQLGNDNRTNTNYPVEISRGGYVAEVPRVCVSWFFGICTGYNVPATIPAIPASAMVGKQVKSLAKLKGVIGTMCIITTEDKTVCWGENHAGQVGNNRTITTPVTGNGSAYSGSGNACSTTNRQALSEAKAGAKPPNPDVLRPTDVQTSLVFDSITIYGGATGDSEDFGNLNGTGRTTRSGTGYSYVTAKTPSSATANPDRLYYWGGSYSFSGYVDCDRNSDTQGGDSTRSTARITRNYSGLSTPSASPLYNAASDGQLNNRLGLISGNPAVTGLFCGIVVSMNQPYCDVHDGTANNGELGNNYRCVPDAFPWTNDCATTWTTPQSVRLDIAKDQYGPVNPVNISTRSITSIDTGSSGYTCMVAQKAVYCWGQNNVGQLGDGTTTDSAVPTAVYYAGGGLGILPGSSSSSPATWENPIWF